MNTTTDVGGPSYSQGSVPYGLGFFIVVLFLLITLCYGSYIYKRGVYTRSSQPPNISLVTTISDYHAHNNHHHSIRISDQGIDDQVLGTFPTFIYSELIMKPHAGDRTSNNSGCAICLADYIPTDVLRLLPECGHLFHVDCINTWLKVHPTCPVCRKSPLPAG